MEEVYFRNLLGCINGKLEASINFKELSIENKSMPIGRGQENVINSEIDHAWAVEWMRLAGCSLYTYTVLYIQYKGSLFLLRSLCFAYTVNKLHPRISSVNVETQSQYQYLESTL